MNTKKDFAGNGTTQIDVTGDTVKKYVSDGVAEVKETDNFVKECARTGENTAVTSGMDGTGDGSLPIQPGSKLAEKPKSKFRSNMHAAAKAYDTGVYRLFAWFENKNNKLKWVVFAIAIIALAAAIAVPASLGKLNHGLLTFVLFLLFPSVIIFGCYKVPLLSKVGVVLFCYMFGMVVGNVGILPDAFTEPMRAGGTSMQQDMQDISIMLGLPLILFSIDVKKWLKTAKTGLLCMLLACVSVIAMVAILTVTLGRKTDVAAELGAMVAGVYTGGTPNIAAIKAALGISSDTFMQFQLYDTVFSLIYLFFLCSFARSFFQKVFKLKPHPFMQQEQSIDAAHDVAAGGAIPDKKAEKQREKELEQEFVQESKAHNSDESIEAYGDVFQPEIFRGLVFALLCAAAILGVSYLLATAIKNAIPGNEAESVFMTVLVLSITTFGIGASFIKPIREIRRSFQLGMYLIYLFCFTIATMTDFSKLISPNWVILGYVLLAIFGSLILHAILCKIFRIDSDTFIITSTAAICSPPFVPVVAGALRNQKVLLTGLITGIIGYAIGNYLGIAIGNLLRLF